MQLPHATMGWNLAGVTTHWTELLHRYAIGVFAISFLLVAGSGVQVAATYWSARINLPTLHTSQPHLPAQPLRGPNMIVASSQLADTMQRITAQSLSLIIGDQGKTIAVSPEITQSWLQIVHDAHHQVAYIHVKDTAIAASLSELTKPFVKAPVNQVTVMHEDGSTAVIAAGQNGTSIGDTTVLARQISQDLLSAKGQQLNVPFSTVPFQSVTAASIDKLLEVNVVTKQMWAYDKGVLTRSFPISAGAPATPTPIGQFQIYQKLPVQDMRGFNVDGTRYFQPHVRWINYFLPGGYAVHGNYWRPQSWFGAINSSHGCVSLPDDQAKWVYDWAPIGTTVIVHR